MFRCYFWFLLVSEIYVFVLFSVVILCYYVALQCCITVLIWCFVLMHNLSCYIVLMFCFDILFWYFWGKPCVAISLSCYVLFFCLYYFVLMFVVVTLRSWFFCNFSLLLRVFILRSYSVPMPCAVTLRCHFMLLFYEQRKYVP